MTNQQAIHVNMLIFPDMTQLDFTGPYEVFSQMPQAQVHVLSRSLEPVRSDLGLRFLPDTTFEAAPPADVLFVPGGVGVNPLMEDAPVLNFLRQQAETARYVTSVCTGALLLGAAGLLRGYRATTYWQALEFLPMLGAQPVEERVVIDRNRITGGGVTSGIDFGLVVVAQLCGERVAQAIQLAIEYNPQPPFQSGSPRQAPPAIVEIVNKHSAESRAKRLDIIRRVAARQEDRH